MFIFLLHTHTGGLKAWNLPKTTGRAPTPRHGCAMVLGDKKMFLFGGKGASYFNDLYTLTSGTLAWAKPRVTGTLLSLFLFLLFLPLSLILSSPSLIFLLFFFSLYLCLSLSLSFSLFLCVYLCEQVHLQ